MWTRKLYKDSFHNVSGLPIFAGQTEPHSNLFGSCIIRPLTNVDWIKLALGGALPPQPSIHQPATVTKLLSYLLRRRGCYTKPADSELSPSPTVLSNNTTQLIARWICFRPRGERVRGWRVSGLVLTETAFISGSDRNSLYQKQAQSTSPVAK